HRRHDELRLAARAGGPEPRLREVRPAARDVELPRGRQGRPHVRHERPAPGAGRARAVQRALERAGRRAEARAGTGARGARLPALDRARRPSRGRGERARGLLGSARGRPDVGRRRLEAAAARLGLGPPARLRGPGASSRAGRLSVRDDEPRLRHPRGRARALAGGRALLRGLDRPRARGRGRPSGVEHRGGEGRGPGDAGPGARRVPEARRGALAGSMLERPLPRLAAAVLLLLTMAALLVTSSRHKKLSYDEYDNLAYGHRILRL